MTSALPVSRWIWLSFGLLIALLAAHAVGVVEDFAASIASPIEGDYGEGIVWQQAALILSPRAYSPSTALPFIVFHYPPLYHLIVRAVAGSDPNLLASGRLVSAVAAVSLSPLVSGLVLACITRAGTRVGWRELVAALTAGLLVLCIHAVRTWGLYMRVDMVALAFSLAGLLAGLLADGRFGGTLLGLLLCVAAVYTKQTSIMPGLALAVFAAFRSRRAALLALGIACGTGLAILSGLQWATGGGFWEHVVGYNQNRFAPRHAYWVFWPERSGMPLMLLILVGALVISRRLLREHGTSEFGQTMRTACRSSASRVGVLACFALSSAMLPLTVFKSGGNYNYLLEWLTLGCVLTGVLLYTLAFEARRWGVWAYAPVTLMIVTAASLPFRALDDEPEAGRLARHDALVARFASASKPILSEDMTLLMEAAKPVIAEPAIVTELAERGQWNERPLLDMIRSRRFAFIATTDTAGRRSGQVDAAMRDAYPRVEDVDDRLWLHLPPE